ncbi:hypothetical protein [uncultured Sphingomonas sp.]|uniref:hypothetical protein n=1 Tax=uncultured Sphingomonas sp. TaxID=158754 RepID=UPI0026264B4F|nr:hypothetical protein [uncultured Sphingomonas sp.]
MALPTTPFHRTAALRERVAVGIVVRAPQGVLWSGKLWVDAMRGTPCRHSESEALEPNFAFNDQSYGTAQRDVSVNGRRSPRSGETPDIFSIEARWTRPSEAGCGGTSTVELRQSLALAPGAIQTLRGDGGLVIELRRR